MPLFEKVSVRFIRERRRCLFVYCLWGAAVHQIFGSVAVLVGLLYVATHLSTCVLLMSPAASGGGLEKDGH